LSLGGYGGSVGVDVVLSGLSSGVYNVTVFGEDVFGNVGVSEVVVFSVVLEPDSFLTSPSVVVVGVVGVVGVVATVALLLYFKRRHSQLSLG